MKAHVRILFTGGGSGGHVYPGLALWRFIQEKHPDAELLYVGARRGLENTIVPHEGLPYQTIDAAPLRRQLSPTVLKTVWKTWRGYREAKGILRKFRPDVVVGTGGYVTLPVVWAAASRRVPSVIWEGNAVPGLTNRLCAKKADVVAVCFEGSESMFPDAKKVVVTGNPRASEVNLPSQQRQLEIRSQYGITAGRKVILCYAGSRGSETMNAAIAKLYPRFAARPDLQLIHVAGPNLYEQMKPALAHLPENVQVYPFIHDMVQLLPQAEIVITRGGSSTLAEICAFGLASILVPSPYVPANHQEENARRLSERGAAKLLLERDLSDVTLWQAIEETVDSGASAVMRDHARALATPDAVERLYAAVTDAVKLKR